MSNSDIEEQIREVYNFEVSTSTISRITKRVTEDIVGLAKPSIRTRISYCLNGCGSGELQSDQQNNIPSNRLRRDGKKEVLGLWLGKNESAAFWMSVLTDIKHREN